MSIRDSSFILPPSSLKVCLAVLLACSGLHAGDWPMWRCDAYRSGSSPEMLPETLHLQWSRQLRTPQPAWPDEPRLQFDRTCEPVVMGKSIFVPSMVSDSVTAYDTDNGVETWRFYTGGPVRFAPVAWRGRLYVASDDGYLYCLNAADGRLVWTFAGAPKPSMVLGNGRLISMWSIRGGPVLRDGIVYFSAGFWPFMGVFIYAVDAETGREIWCNDTTGYTRTGTPHSGVSVSGPAPQGYLVALDKRLLLPCGRTRPALLDRADGRLLHFDMGFRDWANTHVSANESFFFCGSLYRLEESAYTLLYRPVPKTMWEPVVDGSTVYNTYFTNHAVGGDYLDYVRYSDDPGGDIQALDLSKGSEKSVTEGKKPRQRFEIPIAWSHKSGKVRIRAGKRLYGTRGKTVFALDLPQPGKAPRESWSCELDDTPHSLLAADGKLFVVTREGGLHCFAGTERAAKRYPLPKPVSQTTTDKARNLAKEILTSTGVTRGYGLLLGLGDGDLLDELLASSRLHVIAVDSDPARVDAARRRLDKAGLYGNRGAVLVGAPGSFPFPPGMASLVVCADFDAIGLRDGEAEHQPVEALRPYDGVLCIPQSAFGDNLAMDMSFLQNWFRRAYGASDGRLQLTESLTSSPGPLCLRRNGPLPGAGTWTHELADSANSQMSRDSLVKAPLGLLWFGSAMRTGDVFRKSINPPRPQVAGGRMVCQGPDQLFALDVYTGRLIWRRRFPFPKDALHLRYGSSDNRIGWKPEAASESPAPGDVSKIKRVGRPVVSTADAIYVGSWHVVQRLDPATGEPVAEFALPEHPETGKRPHVVQMWVNGDVLVAVTVSGKVPSKEKLEFDVLGLTEKKLVNEVEALSADGLVALDRHSGKVLWQQAAEAGFLATSFYYHNWGNMSNMNTPVAIGNGKVFCLDMLPTELKAVLVRRGMAVEGGGTLKALDLVSGREIWRQNLADFSSLSYSQDHDLLVQSHVPSMHFTNGFAASKVTVRKGTDGTIAWHKDGPLAGPPIVHRDSLIFQSGTAYGLRDGSPASISDPATGEARPWGFRRLYGCSQTSASSEMVLFRSGVISFYGMDGSSGLTNLGGIRSGCNGNLIAADGVLCKPEFEYGCYCNYAIQTSIGLIHTPDAETWSAISLPPAKAAVRRLGLNFGAPGYRVDDAGTPWVGERYPINVTLAPHDGLSYFRGHSARMDGFPPGWITASGVRGVRSISVCLRPGATDSANYCVRLYFSEPDEAKPGERIFSVSLNDNVVLPDVDVAAMAGRRRYGIMREFSGIPVKETLTVTLVPRENVTRPEPVLCGLEIVASPGTK